MTVFADGTVTLDGAKLDATLAGDGVCGRMALLLDGKSHALLAQAVAKGVWDVDAGGGPALARVETERAAIMRKLSATGPGGRVRAVTLKAPMPGLVLQIAVAEGDVVDPGARVVIVEAMKMENELKASAAGRVAKVLVSPGQAVEKGQVLVEFGE